MAIVEKSNSMTVDINHVPVKALVITREENENGKPAFKMEFTIDGELVTYDQIPRYEKLLFAEACKCCMGNLANLVLIETKDEE